VSLQMGRMTPVNAAWRLQHEMSMHKSYRARMLSTGIRPALEQLPSTMRSLPNDICVAPFGDAELDINAEAASRQR
jgi:hypothetical protein